MSSSSFSKCRRFFVQNFAGLFFVYFVVSCMEREVLFLIQSYCSHFDRSPPVLPFFYATVLVRL